MLYPPGHEIKKHVNSKYLAVTMAAKRARYLQENPEDLAMDSYRSLKNVGFALEEIASGKVTAQK